METISNLGHKRWLTSATMNALYEGDYAKRIPNPANCPDWKATWDVYGRRATPTLIPPPYPGYYTTPLRIPCTDDLPNYRRDVTLPNRNKIATMATVDTTLGADGFAVPDTRPKYAYSTPEGPICLGYGQESYLTGQPSIATLRSIWNGDTRTLLLSDRYYQ